MKKILITAALFLSFNAFAGTTNCADENHYPLVTKDQLKSYVQTKQAFVVDVNGPDKFKEAHVPGAVNFDSHQKDFAQVLPQDRNTLIVAYCGGPQCGAWKKAAEQACNMGYTNIKHFKEGLQGWVKN